MPPDRSEQTVVVHVTPGELIDQRWRIETRIGQGAMGSVFKGRDEQQNRVVALKILAPEHSRKPKVIARFEREAELMESLRHQNIVQIYGHGRRGALPFIVMEYLEGLTLSEVIEARGRPLSLGETVSVVRPLASGLAFLHHHELVHRDVKPQNVFMAVGGRVTILDLGVVRDQANPGLTRPGAMVGTPYYMSPEQIQGLDDVDSRTDVYALAAMTFELLTGRPPFLGANNFEVLYAHRNAPPPDASVVARAVPKMVAEVLQRGMAKRREDRPETASEFAADLEAAAGVKRVDLAKAFPLERKKSPRAAPKPQPRPAARPPPPVPAESAEVPMADDSDVHSATDLRALTTEKPLVTEATYVGALPDPSATHDENASRPVVAEQEALDESHDDVPTGQLRVMTTSRGRMVVAQVTIDGFPSGTTPRSFKLDEGRHEVRLELKGSRTVDRTIDITAGETFHLKVELG